MEVTITLTATYETLLDFICDQEIGEAPRRIAVRLHDGSIVEGIAYYAFDTDLEDNCITLLDENELDSTFDLANVKHIHILEDN